jgi:hypothetical protein
LLQLRVCFSNFIYLACRAEAQGVLLVLSAFISLRRDRRALASLRAKAGAHDQDRTDDLILTKDVLYQLSYMGARSNPNFVLIPKNDKKPSPPLFFKS